MATYTAVIPSGSTDGKQVKVAATSTPGTLWHTAHATSLDEAIMDATNSSASDVEVTVEFGGVASPDDQIKVTVPPKAGLFSIIEAKHHRRITNSKEIRVFADTTNVILIGGGINRIT